jgi:hypothetical protein
MASLCGLLKYFIGVNKVDSVRDTCIFKGQKVALQPALLNPFKLPEQVVLLATGTRWSLRIPLATVFIVVERRRTT